MFEEDDILQQSAIVFVYILAVGEPSTVIRSQCSNEHLQPSEFTETRRRAIIDVTQTACTDMQPRHSSRSCRR